MPSTSEPSLWKRPWVILALRIFAALGLLAFPFALRALVFTETLEASVSTVHVISEAMPKSVPSGADPLGFEPLFPVWPGEREEGEFSPDSEKEEKPSRSHEDSGEPFRGRRGQESVAKATNRRRGPTPRSVRASLKQVLGWAEARIVPSGVSRPAGDGIPAGIELKGVAALGLGLVDGDRLVRVNGVPVTLRGQVVGAVLAARVKKAPIMRATLYRMTKKGPVEFFVLVEQPYVNVKPVAESSQTTSLQPMEVLADDLLDAEELDADELDTDEVDLR